MLSDKRSSGTGYFLRKSLKSSSIWSHGSLGLSFSTLPCRGIPLGTSVLACDVLHLLERAFLPKPCPGSLGYPFHTNVLMISTTAIFSSFSTSRARFSTKLFPCLFWNGYPKEPIQCPAHPPFLVSPAS